MKEPVSFSTLSYIARSPAHYKYALEHGRTVTKAMRLGTAVDALLFGGSAPNVFDGASRRTKEWKKYAEWLGPDAAEDALLPDEYVTAQEMTASLRAARAANPEIEAALTGDYFTEWRWQCMGREMISHPDVVRPNPRGITDLKCWRWSEPNKAIWQARDMATAVQIAIYEEAGMAMGVFDRSLAHDHYVVVVESSPPYPVTYLHLGESTLDRGRKTFRLWMERLLACEAADEWPPYSQSAVEWDEPESEELDFSGLDSEGAEEL